jgi:hypothetical protein
MGIIEALLSMLPVVLPPLIKAISEVMAQWAQGKIDTNTAIARMHDAITESGQKMVDFETKLAQQHADFLEQIAKLHAAGK